MKFHWLVTRVVTSLVFLECGKSECHPIRLSKSAVSKTICTSALERHGQARPSELTGLWDLRTPAMAPSDRVAARPADLNRLAKELAPVFEAEVLSSVPFDDSKALRTLRRAHWEKS